MYSLFLCLPPNKPLLPVALRAAADPQMHDAALAVWARHMGACAGGAHRIRPGECCAAVMTRTNDVVRLEHATRKRVGDPAVSEVSGVVLVQNIAPEKQVLVHYRDAAGIWRAVPARYESAPPWGSPERWVFSGIIYPADHAEPARFAIQVVVAGREYWDNNEQHDYLLDPEGIVFGDGQTFGFDRLQRIVEFVGWRYHMDVMKIEEAMPLPGRGYTARYKVTIGRSVGPGRYTHVRCVGIAVRGADVSVLGQTPCESIPPLDPVTP